MMPPNRLPIFVRAWIIAATLMAPAVVSAQTRLVRLPSFADATPGLVVASAPTREFKPGARAGFDEFTSQVAHLAPASFSDGAVAVGDGNSIVVFDREGRFLMRVGRRGGGPGEFGGTGLDGICIVRGDTLLAFSGTDRRVTAFRRDGRLAGTWPYPESVGVAGAGCFGDGRVVFKSRTITGRGTEHPVATGFVGHYSGTHGLRPIGPLPVLSSLGGVREAFVLPYPGDRILTAEASVFGFTLLPSTRGSPQSFRSPDRPLPYTADDYKTFLRNSLPGNVSPQQREMFEASMRNRPRPAAWPTIADALVDASSGEVWLRLYTRDRQAQDWVVVAPGVRRVVRVVLPDAARTASWKLLAVNGSLLTVRWLDADDIPHVGIFRVRPATHLGILGTARRAPLKSGANDPESVTP